MPGNDQIVIRVPSSLKRKIAEAAEAKSVSLQTIILERLSRSFKVKKVVPKQGWSAGRSRKAME